MSVATSLSVQQHTINAVAEGSAKQTDNQSYKRAFGNQAFSEQSYQRRDAVRIHKSKEEILEWKNIQLTKEDEGLHIFKPTFGLWYSFNHEWSERIRYDLSLKKEYKSTYIVQLVDVFTCDPTVPAPDKILQIDLCIPNIHRKLRSIYPCTKPFDRISIDWIAMSKDFAGIEVINHKNCTCEAEQDFYSWEIDSGCLWRLPPSTKLVKLEDGNALFAKLPVKYDVKNFQRRHSWYKHLGVDKSNEFYILLATGVQPGNNPYINTDDEHLHVYFFRDTDQKLRGAIQDKKLLDIFLRHSIMLNAFIYGDKNRWPTEFIDHPKESNKWLQEQYPNEHAQLTKLTQTTKVNYTSIRSIQKVIHNLESERQVKLIYKTIQDLCDELALSGYTYEDIAKSVSFDSVITGHTQQAKMENELANCPVGATCIDTVKEEYMCTYTRLEIGWNVKIAIPNHSLHKFHLLKYEKHKDLLENRYTRYILLEDKFISFDFMDKNILYSSLFKLMTTCRQAINDIHFILVSGPCTVCSGATITRCKQCKRTFYCSREHQREDWKQHKQTCKLSGDGETNSNQQ
jgi:hypothetical protein